MKNLLKKTVSILTALAILLSNMAVLAEGEGTLPTLEVGSGIHGMLDPTAEIRTYAGRSGDVRFTLTLSEECGISVAWNGSGLSLTRPDQSSPVYTFTRHVEGDEYAVISMTSTGATGYTLTSEILPEEPAREPEATQEEAVDEEPAPEEMQEETVDEESLPEEMQEETVDEKPVPEEAEKETVDEEPAHEVTQEEVTAEEPAPVEEAAEEPRETIQEEHQEEPQEEQQAPEEDIESEQKEPEITAEEKHDEIQEKTEEDTQDVLQEELQEELLKESQTTGNEDNDVIVETVDEPAQETKEEDAEPAQETSETEPANQPEAPQEPKTAENIDIPAVTQDDTTQPETSTEAQSEPEAAPEEPNVTETVDGYLEGQLIFHGRDYTVTATFTADACLPAGTTLAVREISRSSAEYAELTGTTNDMLREDWNQIKGLARFFDITFICDGEEVEPFAQVDVQISFDQNITPEGDNTVRTIHISDEGDAALVNNSATDDAVSFSADQFSIYGVVEVGALTKTISRGGKNYSIRVEYGEDAGIPLDAVLVVQEITEASENYDEYQRQAALAMKADDAEFLGLYDIGIYANGERIKPASEVKVTIRGTNKLDSEKLKVVHFHENANGTDSVTEAVRQNKEPESVTSDQVEVIDDLNVLSKTVTFETSGFSVFGLAYTIDITYEDEDGSTYAYSLPGHSAYPLSEVIQDLPFAGEGEITAATLTLNGAPVSSDNTALRVYEENGVWYLASSEAFADTYILTVTMEDKDYTIAVKDDQNYLVKVIFRDQSGNEMNSNITVGTNWQIVVDAWGNQTTKVITTENNKIYTFSVQNEAYQAASVSHIKYPGQYSEVTANNGDIVGNYSILINNNYDGNDANATVTFQLLPSYTTNVTYMLDATTIDNNPTVSSGYHILAKSGDNKKYYATFSSSDGSLIWHNSNDDTVTEIFGVTSFELRYYTNGDVVFATADQGDVVNRTDAYTFTLPPTLEGNVYQFTATKLPCYTVNFDYSAVPTNHADGNYWVFVQAQKDGQNYGAVKQVQISNGRLQPVEITTLKYNDSTTISYNSNLNVIAVQLLKNDNQPGVNNGNVNNAGTLLNNNVADGCLYTAPTIVPDAATYTYTVTDAPEYTVRVELNGNADDSLNGKYVFATITRGEGDNKRTYVSQHEIKSLPIGETEYDEFKLGTFTCNNDSITYLSSDTVTVSFTNGLIENVNNPTGLLGSGDIVDNKYVLNITANQQANKTTLKLNRFPVYQYTVQTSDGSSISFDDTTAKWYLVATLKKASGGAYVSVQAVDLQGETNVSGAFGFNENGIFINRSDMHKVGANIENPDYSNLSISAYIPGQGDAVDLQLVRVDQSASPQKIGDVAEPQYNIPNGWKIISNGEIVDKYTLTTDDGPVTNPDPACGTYTLTKLDPLMVHTETKEGDVAASSPTGYSLLLEMTDSDGSKYYQLQPINSSTDNAAGVDVGGFCKLLNSYGTYSLAEKLTYYSGTETITARVVNTGSLTVELARGTDHNAQYYDVGSVLAKNDSLYRYNGATLAADGLLTASFTVQPNTGTEHKINLDFYEAKVDEDDAEPVLDDDAALSGYYFFRVRLLDKATTTVDSNGKITKPGKVVAYKYVQLGTPSITGGHFDTTLAATDTANPFKLVDANGTDVDGQTVNYVPAAYVIDVRLYHCKPDNQYPSSLEEASTKGHDTIDGYDFWDNLLKEATHQTNIRLYSAYQKVYQIQVEIDPAATVSAYDNLSIRDDVTHQTSGTEYYTHALESTPDAEDHITVETIDGKKVITYVVYDEKNQINQWTYNDGIPRNITGNETFTLRLYQGNKEMPESSPVKIGDDYYQVSYKKAQTKSDSNSVTTITDYITLTKIDFNHLTYEKVTGPGVYFGIAVDNFYNTGHIQTNIAVNDYYGSGGEINPNLAKTDEGSGATGVIAASHIMDGRMYLNINESDGKALVFVDPDDEKYVTDSAGGIRNGEFYVTVPTDRSAIESGIVNPILNHGAAMSEELIENGREYTYTPTFGSNGSYVDLTMFPENATIYIDGDAYASKIAESDGFQFNTRPGQVVVFNFESTSSVTIQKVKMFVDGQEQQPAEVYTAEHVVYNCASATTVKLYGAYGMFLAPRDDVDITIYNSSEGWLISSGTLHQHDYGAEWHLKSRNMKKDTTASVNFGKTVDGKAPKLSQVFGFQVDKWTGQEAPNDWEFKTLLYNSGSSIRYDVELNHGRIFRISEKADGTSGKYTTDPKTYYVLIRYVGSGSTTLAAYAEYYSTFDAAYDVFQNGVNAADESKKKKLNAIVFENKTVMGGLQISKEVTGTTATDQEFSFTLHLWNDQPDDSKYAYTGDITGKLDTENWTGTAAGTENITIDGNEYDATKVTFTLTAGQKLSITSLPVGTHYVVEEDTAGLSALNYGFVSVDNNGTTQTSSSQVTGQITSATTPIQVKYTNNYLTGSLAIEKKVAVNGTELTSATAAANASLVDGTYTFVITGPSPATTTKTVTITFDGGIATAATIDGATATVTDGKVKVGGLLAGSYSVEETARTNNTSLLAGITNPQTVTVTAGENTNVDTASFTNNRENYSLTVTKTLAGETAPTEDTDYEITITSSTEMNINAATDVTGYKSGTTPTLSTDKKTLSFTVVANSTSNGSVTISKLNSGTYTVTETAGGYTTTYTKQVGTGTAEEGNEIALSSSAQSGTVNVLNTYANKGKLKVQKTIQVNGAEPTLENAHLISDTYTFKVYKAIDTEDGPANDTVLDTITITFSNTDTTYVRTTVSKDLEAGKYWVVEDPATLLTGTNGQCVTVTAGVKAIDAIGTAGTATYTNNIDIGNLSVAKTVEDAPASASTKTFKIRVKQGTTIYAQDGTVVTSGDGWVIFTSGETKTWSDLPVGTYTVEEDETDAEIADYSLEVTGDGDIQVNKDHTASDPATTTVNNKYTQEKGNLTLKKTIAGATLTADKTYYFTIQRKEGETWKYCGCDSDGVMTDATDTPQYVGVTVPAGQTNAEVTIADVPFGYYAIAEVNDSEHSAELVGLELITDEGKTVEINSGTTPAVVEFTNTYYGAPKFQKKIEDKNDTTGETSGWQDSADYDIGDDIRYQLTAILPDNVTDYYQYYLTFHDKMEESLTFQKILSVKVGNTILPESGYWLKNVTEHSFELKIPFEEETNKAAPNHNAAKIQNGELNGANVEVIFTAKLNDKAKLGTEGNVNGAYLEYSNNCSLDEQGKPKDSTDKTELDAVIAFTYQLNINKVDEDGTTPLEGAEFKLEKKLAGDKPEEIARLTVKEKKTFCFKGLDDGDYILTETKAPDGYLLAKPITFTVEATHDPDWPVSVLWNTELKDLNRTGILTELTGTAENGVITLTDDVKHAELIGNVRNEGVSIKVQKTDIATGAELSGATIQILDHEGNKVAEWVSVAGQSHEVTGLVIGETYTLHEVVAPKGYLLTADTVFFIDENGIPHSGLTANRTMTTSADGTPIRTLDGVLLVQDQMKTSAMIRKVWDDNDNRDGLRPAGLTVALLADGKDSGRSVTLNAANHWTARLDDLPLTDRNGKTITYTWKEPVVEGYTSTSIKTDDGMLTTLINTHGPEKTEVSVRKVWADNNDAEKIRPDSITVQLFADGIAAGEPVTLGANNKWAYSWTDLDLNIYENGVSRAIRYTVAEMEIPEGYEGKVTGNASTGFVITNTFIETGKGKLIIEKTFDIDIPEPEEETEEETTDFEVEKVWVDDNDNADGNRPESITVRLYAGGQEIKVVKLNASNGWRHHFGNLPKFVNGKPIHYSVREDPVEEYVTEIDGFTIYNKYQPEMTQVTVRKIWNDENNKDQKRPESIWMKLNNGMTVMLNEGNGWTATIAGLPAKVNGKPAEYTWTEQSVIGYELESVVTEDSITIFTNRLWTRPDAPSQGRTPKTAGDTVYTFEEYDTPLGVEIVINHVGDCFD